MPDENTSMPPREAALFARMRKAAEDAARNNPHIPAHVFQNIVTAYENDRPAFKAEAEALSKASAQGAPPHPGWLRQEYGKIQMKHYNLVRDQIVASHPQGAEAFDAMGKQLKPVGIFEGVIKQVYDSDKGGLQIDGLIGGAIGAFAGYNLLGAAGGGWFGRIAMVLATILGAWAGNKAGDMISGFINKKNTPQPQVQVTGKGKAIAGQQPQQEQEPLRVLHQTSPDALAHATDAVRNTGAGPVTDITPENSAQLPSQAALPPGAKAPGQPGVPDHG